MFCQCSYCVICIFLCTRLGKKLTFYISRWLASCGLMTIGNFCRATSHVPLRLVYSISSARKLALIIFSTRYFSRRNFLYMQDLLCIITSFRIFKKLQLIFFVVAKCSRLSHFNICIFSTQIRKSHAADK